MCVLSGVSLEKVLSLGFPHHGQSRRYQNRITENFVKITTSQNNQEFVFLDRGKIYIFT